MRPRSRKRAPRLELTVQYAVAPPHLPLEADIRKCVRAALEHDARMTVRIVAGVEGRALNRRFRGHDHATNVLAFAYRDAPPYEGDVVICAPVVAREARAQGKSIAAHYAHLIVHGTLHLQGYDHQRPADASVMERRESQIVVKLGYPDPYAARDRARAGGRTLRAA